MIGILSSLSFPFDIHDTIYLHLNDDLINIFLIMSQNTVLDCLN